MRELEQKCESREAAASKRTVTRLQAQSPGFREAFIKNCSIYGLANLARCAIEAGVSPNTRDAASKPANEPILCRAAQEGHARVVKLLLNVLPLVLGVGQLTPRLVAYRLQLCHFATTFGRLSVVLAF